MLPLQLWWGRSLWVLPADRVCVWAGRTLGLRLAQHYYVPDLWSPSAICQEFCTVWTSLHHPAWPASVALDRAKCGDRTKLGKCRISVSPHTSVDEGWWKITFLFHGLMSSKIHFHEQSLDYSWCKYANSEVLSACKISLPEPDFTPSTLPFWFPAADGMGSASEGNCYYFFFSLHGAFLWQGSNSTSKPRSGFLSISNRLDARTMTYFLGNPPNDGISPNGDSQKIKFLGTFFSRQQPNGLNKISTMT